MCFCGYLMGYPLSAENAMEASYGGTKCPEFTPYTTQVLAAATRYLSINRLCTKISSDFCSSPLYQPL